MRVGLRWRTEVQWDRRPGKGEEFHVKQWHRDMGRLALIPLAPRPAWSTLLDRSEESCTQQAAATVGANNLGVRPGGNDHDR